MIPNPVSGTMASTGRDPVATGADVSSRAGLAAPGGGPAAAATTAAVAGAAAATGPVDRDAGGRVHRITAMTTNESALRMNAVSTPPTASRIPPIAGPMMKLTFCRLAQALLAGPSWRSSVTRLGM